MLSIDPRQEDNQTLGSRWRSVPGNSCQGQRRTFLCPSITLFTFSVYCCLFFLYFITVFIYLYSDPGHKADGEVVARSEEQPEQIRQLHSEDADRYSTQWWRPHRAGQDGVNNKASTSLSDKHEGPVSTSLLSSFVFRLLKWHFHWSAGF